MVGGISFLKNGILSILEYRYLVLSVRKHVKASLSDKALKRENMSHQQYYLSCLVT